MEEQVWGWRFAVGKAVSAAVQPNLGNEASLGTLQRREENMLLIGVWANRRFHVYVKGILR